MQIIGDFGRGISEAFSQVEKATRGVTSGTFTVDQHNVLAAAKIIEGQADALRETWRNARRDMRIDPPGSDDVSTRIASAWNDRLLAADDSYANRVLEYITGLKKLAVQLGDTAKAYGYTEDQIEAAFKGR
ncbi:PE domain-containing protein [Actinophytocola sp.]|uniref:PE domain-containing protein n=1 Tax=Actinophytocola sp. TaxID=1872138 RepID=UPI0025C32F47|nr:PE domain-containing protein [Actinophytocola sp.]